MATLGDLIELAREHDVKRPEDVPIRVGVANHRHMEEGENPMDRVGSGENSWGVKLTENERGNRVFVVVRFD
jgi:hypothetical protein